MGGPGGPWTDAGDRNSHPAGPGPPGRALNPSYTLKIKPKHKFETELAYAMRSRGSNRQAFLKQPLKITLIVTEHEKNKTKHKRLEI